MGIAARAALVKGGGAVSGLDNATEILGFLNALGSKVKGVALLSTSRTKGKATNDEIIDYNAEAHTYQNGYTRPARDIRPTQEDSDAGALVWRTAIERRLRMISKRGKPLKKWTKAKQAKFILKGEKTATAIAATGGRKAAHLIRDRMAARIESGRFAPVKPSYAKARAARTGNPESDVLKASGQLLGNLRSGRIKIISRAALTSAFASDLKSLIGL